MHANSATRDQRPGETDELLTVKELEAMLKIDAKTIYGYVQKQLIPYVRIQTNLRFRRAEIFEWIEQQTYRPHLAKHRAGS